LKPSFRACLTHSRFAGSRQIAKFLTEKQLIMVFRDTSRSERITAGKSFSRPELVEWTREQVLFEARKAAIPPMSEEGEAQTIPKNVVRDTTGTVRARDIRRLLIDLEYGDPELLVRRHSTLVKLPPLTAIVMHDRCFVFVPDGADSLLGVLTEHLCAASSQEDAPPHNSVSPHDPVSVRGHAQDEILPFELKAIEGILVTVRPTSPPRFDPLPPPLAHSRMVQFCVLI
jgi:hypothetical protein